MQVNIIRNKWHGMNNYGICKINVLQLHLIWLGTSRSSFKYYAQHKNVFY